jgi:hypothetical protein
MKKNFKQENKIKFFFQCLNEIKFLMYFLASIFEFDFYIFQNNIFSLLHIPTIIMVFVYKYEFL